MRMFVVLIVLLSIGGCAVVDTPKSSLIDTLPVVMVGTTTDTPRDHILFIPGGTEFPIEFAVSGSVLQSDCGSQVLTSFSEDLYLYKSWVSSNGRDWQEFSSLVRLEPSGGFNAAGARVEVKLNFLR